jgi:predicted ferric reductase
LICLNAIAGYLDILVQRGRCSARILSPSGATRRAAAEASKVSIAMRMLGPAAAIALCLAAFALALRTGLSYGVTNAISIGAGAVSLVAMSQCLMLAARPRFLEGVFGGLDRMYHVHKWLGIAALAAMVLHEQLEPDFERWTRETALGEVGEQLGEIGYYALIALILFSWIKRIPSINWEIPYHLWWFTHRLTGAFFTLAVLHQLFIDTPFGWADPLSLLLIASGAVGIACYLFIEFVAARWRRRTYRVATLTQEGGATRLTLLPSGRAMRWRPGQFAFLSASAGRGEAHPFTIAGRPDPNNSIRFMIKPLGDWTRRLPQRLRPGDAVEVEGPYGRFDFRKGGNRQIWIAGGVGITPFLAWVQDLSKDARRRIHLFYSVRTAGEAIGLDILKEAAILFPGFSFDLVVSDEGRRLDAKGVVDGAPFDLRGADFFFCGPVGLRGAILKGLESLDAMPRRVRFEHFQFR